MHHHRANENEHDNSAQRTSRGYEINGQWYFELRDGGQKGPFANEEEMLAELQESILALDGVGGLALDVTSKPPGTIEWE